VTRQRHELTKEDWDETLDAIRLFLNLERPEFREEVEGLARELEREGLAAHRAADHLEGLTRNTKHGQPSDYVLRNSQHRDHRNRGIVITETAAS
jgi:hypothetical protein